jgi:hypothetical protein
MGFWLTLFIYAFLVVLGELLRPKPDLENAKPAGLGDFQFPTATEGRVVPLIWGTIQIKGPNVIWYGDLVQEALTETVKTGLFSKEKVIVGFKYHLGFQMALCRGPGVDLKEVWIGEKRALDTVTVSHNQTFDIDKPEFFGGLDLGNGGVVGTLRFFGGEANQPLSSYLSNHQQIGVNLKTPHYRGTCYVAPDEDPIYVGNSTSIRPWWFELKRIPNGLGLGSHATVNGADANPMNVIYEIMTDTDWGLGFETSDIDTTSFTDAAIVLFNEGNGFSHVQDREIEAIDLIRLVEEQIDGIVFLDPLDGKWKVNLARDDYDINTVPEINETNLVEMQSFTRGSWEDTTNIVRVSFVDRDDEYKETYALAQDMANQRLQNGVNVSTTQNFPGCKNAALANQLALRTLRTVSYPLAKATLIVDRTFYAIQPGQVVAFTDPDLGFIRLPMRVTRINFGQLVDNKITLDLVQDIFSFQAGVFGNPGGSNWEPPADELQPFPVDQQMAIEAPRAFITRDPDFNGYVDKIWAGARRIGPEVSFKIMERHSPSTPSGAFAEAGESFGFLFIGELSGSLAKGSAFPLASLTVVPDPDSQSAIEGAFQDSASASDLGVELVNLILVGDEFMLVEGAQTSGANVQLNNVWRGALDSVQDDHASGTPVFLVWLGGSITDTNFNSQDNVDIKLLPRSLTDLLDESDAITIQITPMDDRVRRPYPPSSVRLNNSLWAASVSLEATGSGGETYGIPSEWRRRDYRTVDELEALDTDAEDLFPDFPAANATEHDIEVRDDPGGTNTLLFTETFATKDFTALRVKILRFTDGVLPTTLRFVVTARHTDAGSDYESMQSLSWDFSVTTVLTGQFNFGALDTNNVSNLYTATVNGTYAFTLSSAFAAGNVEYRLNGGAWTTLISATNTTGNIAGVVNTDTIEIRHLSSDVGALKHIDMNAPGIGQDAYAILYV